METDPTKQVSVCDSAMCSQLETVSTASRDKRMKVTEQFETTVMDILLTIPVINNDRDSSFIRLQRRSVFETKLWAFVDDFQVSASISLE